LQVSGSAAIARLEVVSILAALVIKRATWQIQQLRYLHRPVLMFIDEPPFGIAGHHQLVVEARVLCPHPSMRGGVMSNRRPGRSWSQ
jgi:hypothetical protein